MNKKLEKLESLELTIIDQLILFMQKQSNNAQAAEVIFRLSEALKNVTTARLMNEEVQNEGMPDEGQIETFLPGGIG